MIDNPHIEMNEWLKGVQSGVSIVSMWSFCKKIHNKLEKKALNQNLYYTHVTAIKSSGKIQQLGDDRFIFVQTN